MIEGKTEGRHLDSFSSADDHYLSCLDLLPGRIDVINDDDDNNSIKLLLLLLFYSKNVMSFNT